ncbi:T6SS phospholipase effector Tle1-like catalytic domain-containing protein, partial [Pseudomonas huaxiensis]
HSSETHRGEVREFWNAEEPEGLLRALFDDHVHDSRAWFLYLYGREPFGSYFGERMVFFGGTHRRALARLPGHDAALLAEGETPAAGSPAQAPEPREMSPEQMAEAQKQIEADWQRFYASLEEKHDVQ